MIPKSFKIMGSDYKVDIVPEDVWPDDEVNGYCRHPECEITVRGGLSDQARQQVFCHELVHAILHKMGEEKLCDNEKFVDLFGSIMHQVWTTIE